MKVLLIEDDSAISLTCRLMLEQYGHSVEILPLLPIISPTENGGKFEVDFQKLNEIAERNDVIVCDGAMNVTPERDYPGECKDFSYEVRSGRVTLPDYYSHVGGAFMTHKGIVAKISEDFKGPMIAWSGNPAARAQQLESGCTYSIEKKDGKKLAELLKLLEEEMVAA